MKDLFCENCGSKQLVEVNGIVTCQACGTKYPNLELTKLGIKEEAKEQEIRRLIKGHSNIFGVDQRLEPRLGLLTDDEILQYAPKSEAANDIMFERTGKLKYKTESIGGLIGIFLLIDPTIGCFLFLAWGIIPTLIIIIIIDLIIIVIFYKMYLTPNKK